MTTTLVPLAIPAVEAPANRARLAGASTAGIAKGTSVVVIAGLVIGCGHTSCDRIAPIIGAEFSVITGQGSKTWQTNRFRTHVCSGAGIAIIARIRIGQFESLR